MPTEEKTTESTDEQSAVITLMETMGWHDVVIVYGAVSGDGDDAVYTIGEATAFSTVLEPGEFMEMAGYVDERRDEEPEQVVN